jgi:hypothetical protein
MDGKKGWEKMNDGKSESIEGTGCERRPSCGSGTMKVSDKSTGCLWKDIGFVTLFFLTQNKMRTKNQYGTKRSWLIKRLKIRRKVCLVIRRIAERKVWPDFKWPFSEVIHKFCG